MVYALVIVKDSRILREVKQARNRSEVGMQQNHEENHEVLVRSKVKHNKVVNMINENLLSIGSSKWYK